MAGEKDLYGVLGVAKEATAEELRRVYRKLARKYHPDVNSGDKDAEERFKSVSSAYDVLSDPAKRKLYDEFGDVGIREGFDVEKARAYQRWAGRGAASPPHNPMGGATGAGAEFDLGDMLGDLFGRRGPRGPRRGRDLVTTVDIDFAQALRGTEVQLQMPAQAACATCQGSGRQRGAIVCPACQGSGRSHTSELLTVRIPPGADAGSKLRVTGRGEPGGAGGGAGDLLIETRIAPHPYFKRDGLDIYLRLPVTLHEAYNGASIAVPTPGGTVKLRVPPQSQQGARLRLRGQGVSRGSKTGDMYAELDIRLPDRPHAGLSEAALAAEAAYSGPVRGELSL